MFTMQSLLGAGLTRRRYVFLVVVTAAIAVALTATLMVGFVGSTAASDDPWAGGSWSSWSTSLTPHSAPTVVQPDPVPSWDGPLGGSWS
jgi:hypothetical protein